MPYNSFILHPGTPITINIDNSNIMNNYFKSSFLLSHEYGDFTYDNNNYNNSQQKFSTSTYDPNIPSNTLIHNDYGFYSTITLSNSRFYTNNYYSLIISEWIEIFNSVNNLIQGISDNKNILYSSTYQQSAIYINSSNVNIETTIFTNLMVPFLLNNLYEISHTNITITESNFNNN